MSIPYHPLSQPFDDSVWLSLDALPEEVEEGWYASLQEAPEAQPFLKKFEKRQNSEIFEENNGFSD